jgi:Fic family protein
MRKLLRSFAYRKTGLRMALYIWQNEGWPQMSWDGKLLSSLLAEVNMLRGKLMGVVSLFGFQEQNDAFVNAISEEIVHSAKIEGQELDHDSVRSSVARQLGLASAGLPVPDHYTEGVVQVMLDATQHYDMPLTAERLFNWHAALFPTGRSGMYKITVGAWRREGGAMQVVSGAMGHEKVHYEAPGNSDVPTMMNEFLEWVNAVDSPADPLVKAAVAHLWFVSIHPFDDGNGRLCRTITEMLLSRADATRQRYYSLSSVFLSNRKEYYNHLEEAQKGSLDITAWIEWFLRQLREALLTSLRKTERVKLKRMFWDKNRSVSFNDRQRKVVNMLLDGFEGKLTSSKWYKINHCSQDTANRDINDLIHKGILTKTPGSGRSTAYELTGPENTNGADF